MEIWGKAIVFMIGIVALGALAVSCSSNSPTKTTSPESYADAICNVLSNRLSDISGLGSDGSIDLGNIANSDTEANKKALSAAASANRSIARDLENIQPPAEIASLHNKIVTAYQDRGEALDGIVKALDESPDEAVPTIEAIQGELQDATNDFGSLPDNYQQALKDSEVCKSLEQSTPTPAE